MKYCSVLKKNELSSPGKSWKTLTYILLTVYSEKFPHCVIPNICYSRKGKTIEIFKKISGCRDGVEEGLSRWSTENIESNKTSRYATLMMDKCHYRFVQTYRTYNTDSEPLCKLWTLNDYDASVEVDQL